jgi:proteasome lid subunit RPN8/RPN11
VTLSLTYSVMQEMAKGGRVRLPQEACGFVIAARSEPDVGVRVRWVRNTAPEPNIHYLMDDVEVRDLYAECDQADEDPIAVFHTHPTTEPTMSPVDLARAVDTSLAYVIISFASPTMKVRSWRVQQFIGNTIAIADPIQMRQEPDQALSSPPAGPWALLAGNRVRIVYQRTGKQVPSTCVATVVGCTVEEVTLTPDHRTGPASLPLSRIRSVHVIRESLLAAAARKGLRAYAQQAQILLAGSDVVALPSLTEALSRAFPPGITITMDEPKP